MSLLVDVAKTQPHAAFAAFIHGYVHKFNYLCRTVPNVDHALQPLEDQIRSQLIPVITGHSPPNDTTRDLFSLPARLGGIGLINPTKSSSLQHQASSSISAPLKEQILAQNNEYSMECIDAQVEAKVEAQKRQRNHAKDSATALKASSSHSLQRAMDLAQEKGASSWLTTLPLEEFGFNLHKTAFSDAIAQRYGWQPSRCPSSCACCSNFSIEHALSCPKGDSLSYATTRSGTSLQTCLPKYATMSVWNPPYNQSPAKRSPMPLPTLRMVPDSTLLQADSGAAALREPSLMSVFLILMPPQIGNPFPPVIENTRT